MTLLLTDEDVTRLLSMSDCMKELEAVYTDMGRGMTFNAPRRDSFLTTSRNDAYFSFKTMEGGSERLKVVAQRVDCDLISHPIIDGNRRRVKIAAAPGNRYVGLIFLYSMKNLELLAIINDGQLQRMRVAGTTGVGVRKLARKNSKKAALIGAGWQAGAAALALAEARRLTRIAVFSTNSSHREEFATTASKQLGIDVIPAESAEQAVKDSDIVAAATNSHTPVIRHDLIEKGMHLTSVRRFEFDEASWRKADLLYFSAPPGNNGFSHYASETWEKSQHESDVNSEVLLEERVFKLFKSKTYMLSDLLTGKAPGRTSEDQITMMNKNWGLGIEFASVGKLVYDLAVENNMGKEIPGTQFSQTSHP
jgi:ornithine cyclodeaminase/alanine dehydrogenase-like protein (mu-crystallin family)